MKVVATCAVLALALAAAVPADAKGCLKGALVGGAAGHYAGHHGWLGAAAGCAIAPRLALERRCSLRGLPESFLAMGKGAEPFSSFLVIPKLHPSLTATGWTLSPDRGWLPSPPRVDPVTRRGGALHHGCAQAGTR